MVVRLMSRENVTGEKETFESTQYFIEPRKALVSYGYIHEFWFFNICSEANNELYSLYEMLWCNWIGLCRKTCFVELWSKCTYKYVKDTVFMEVKAAALGRGNGNGH